MVGKDTKKWSLDDIRAARREIFPMNVARTELMLDDEEICFRVNTIAQQAHVIYAALCKSIGDTQKVRNLLGSNPAYVTFFEGENSARHIIEKNGPPTEADIEIWDLVVASIQTIQDALSRRASSKLII